MIMPPILSYEGPTLETLDFAFHIGSTLTDLRTLFAVNYRSFNWLVYLTNWMIEPRGY